MIRRFSDRRARSMWLQSGLDDGWMDSLRDTCGVIGVTTGDSASESAALCADGYWKCDERTRRGLPRLVERRVLVGVDGEQRL